MESQVMLSIIVTTYGHEKYIARALDSILFQRTKYLFEVLVGEDKSPDGTREILKGYEKNYPGIFQMFYREHNMNSNPNGISNGMDLRLRARGKYMINLEGDDFWTSPDKIERQITFLENHPEYIAVAHDCVVVGEDSEPNGEHYQGCMDEEYTLKHYLHHIMPGQLATIMYKNIWLDKDIDKSLLEKRLSPGDRLLYFLLVSNGKVYCMQEKLSAYRHVTHGGYSYSANLKYNFEKMEEWNLAVLNYARLINKKESILCAEAVYIAEIVGAYRGKHISKETMVNLIKANIKHRWSSYGLYFLRCFERLVQKKHYR